MRKNEYNSLNDFISEYTGTWNPSEEHWLGLDFKYKERIYRLNTGSMYTEENTLLPNGKEAVYGLYMKEKHSKNPYPDMSQCILLGEFSDMESLLESKKIDSRPFKEIIMDDETEILGKD